jgi:hypothetical protein
MAAQTDAEIAAAGYDVELAAADVITSKDVVTTGAANDWIHPSAGGPWDGRTVASLRHEHPTFRARRKLPLHGDDVILGDRDEIRIDASCSWSRVTAWAGRTVGNIRRHYPGLQARRRHVPGTLPAPVPADRSFLSPTDAAAVLVRQKAAALGVLPHACARDGCSELSETPFPEDRNGHRVCPVHARCGCNRHDVGPSRDPYEGHRAFLALAGVERARDETSRIGKALGASRQQTLGQ